MLNKNKIDYVKMINDFIEDREESTMLTENDLLANTLKTIDSLGNKVNFPKYEMSPFGLKGFLSTNYENKSENISYRLEVVQGSNYSDCVDFKSELRTAIKYVIEMDTAEFIDIPEMFSRVNEPVISVDESALDNYMYNRTGSYDAVDKMQLVRTLEAYKKLNTSEVIKLHVMCATLTEFGKLYTKILAYSANTIVDYLATVYVSLYKTDVLIINPVKTLNKEDCEIGLFTNLKYDHPDVLSEAKVTNSVDNGLFSMSSTAYIAEKAVVDKYNSDLYIDKDLEHRVCYVNLTASEFDLAGNTYKSKQDYLNIKNNGPYTYLPVISGILKRDVLHAGKKNLKSYYDTICRKADILFIDGVLNEWEVKDDESISMPFIDALRDADIYDVVRLIETHIPTEVNMDDKVKQLLARQFKAIYNQKILSDLDISVLLRTAAMLTNDIVAELNLRTQSSKTFLVVAQFNSEGTSKDWKIRFSYLTLLNMLGVDTVVLDPYDVVQISCKGLGSLTNIIQGSTVPDKFSYKYKAKKSIFGW